VDRDLSRLWFRWRRIAPPVERFRAGDWRAVSYDVECAIDHLAGSVAALMDGLASGREWEFATLAAHRLCDLERIEGMLGAIDLDPADKGRIAAYLADTRALLDEIARG